MIEFGTDGIRGVAGKELTARTAFALGNALCRLRRAPRVVTGRDTRTSSGMLALALAAGVAAGGGLVLDGGVLPTAAVSFFVRREGADFGVVVSASHNPPEYNGLKVFGGGGCKLTEGEEARLARGADEYDFAPALACGGCRPLPRRGGYAGYLAAAGGYAAAGGEECPLAGKTFVLDCAYGAASAFAPRVFRRLGARVVSLCCGQDGRRINVGCGALHPARLCRAVRESGADAGFCFDGDADRVIAADEKGRVVDGDQILYILARALRAQGKLPGGLAVGTAHTNTGVERALAAEGIRLLRTDVGDKYVAAEMRRRGAAVGGEQSGHIILADFAATGDGILTAVMLAKLLRGETLSALASAPLLPQVNRSVRVRDKVRVLGSERLCAAVARESANVERLIVRASGTEPLVRVFAEAASRRAALRAVERVAAEIAAGEA